MSVLSRKVVFIMPVAVDATVQDLQHVGHDDFSKHLEEEIAMSIEMQISLNSNKSPRSRGSRY